MESIISKKINASDANDRISSLSDELIIHIISFLPTKYAVATGILAKRWRYLWTDVTSLYFDYYTKTERPKYYDFVDRVLQQCTSKTVQRFYLRAQNADINRVQAWVNEAVRRKVYELELSLANFPSFMSTSETLTVMKIYSRKSDFEIPTSFHLPNLRILSLDIRVPTNILSEKLFQSCPALEDLDITAERGYWKNLNFIISSPVLKRLRLYLGVAVVSYHKIVVNAPNLEYMNIINLMVAYFEMINLSSIAEAVVDVKGIAYYDIDELKIYKRVVKLLGGLSGVKYLSLTSNTMQALEFHFSHEPHPPLPILYSVTKLTLRDIRCCGWWMLSSLLGTTPNLKVLILQMGRSYDPGPNFKRDREYSPHRCIELQSLPELLPMHLEIVQIEAFIGDEYEIKLVEYLLMHCAELKKITIKPVRVPPEEKVKYCQKLLECPRSSRCQIHILE